MHGVLLCSAVLAQVPVWSTGAAAPHPHHGQLPLSSHHQHGLHSAATEREIPGRGRGRKQQNYGLKHLNFVFHQCGGQLLTGKGRGLY